MKAKNQFHFDIKIFQISGVGTVHTAAVDLPGHVVRVDLLPSGAFSLQRDHVRLPVENEQGILTVIVVSVVLSPSLLMEPMQGQVAERSVDANEVSSGQRAMATGNGPHKRESLAAAGKDFGCQHYRRKCKFYVSLEL